MCHLSLRWALPSAILGFLLAGIVMSPPLATGQTFYGSVVGTVTDASSAAIANAPITLTNTGTAEVRASQTDDNGNYQFLNLVPGVYKIDVQQTGFKHLTRDQVQVRVDTAT